MTTELFFLYDTHCPWSYTVTPLINAIDKALPNVQINLWHNAYYDGETHLKKSDIDEVMKLSDVSFGENYLQNLSLNPPLNLDSTLAANIMTWAQHKNPQNALALLNSIQQAHFQEGNPLTNKADFDGIISQLKLSPPAKVFSHDKLTKDAEAQVHEIFALQEIIGTKAIPALLLAIDDNLVLLNHNFYLNNANAIVEAIELEIKKYS